MVFSVRIEQYAMTPAIPNTNTPAKSNAQVIPLHRMELPPFR
jgi:hypothetical protein